MTVADIEERFGMRELIAWREFEDDFGPVTLHERIDALTQAVTGQPVRWRRQQTGNMGDWLHMMARR